MAKRIGKHTLRGSKGIADEMVRRATADITDRLNEFTSVFADADGGTTKFLRADMTWGAPRAGEYLVSASAFHPAVTANWTRPSGTTDYYTTTAAGTGMHIPLPLMVGDHVTHVRFSFYRNGANNPSGMALYSTREGSSASARTPIAVWTTPTASTTWQVLEAEYDQVIERGNYYLYVVVNNIGDRIRAAYVTVSSGRQE